MTLQECYDRAGGSLGDALGRLRRPDRIEKYLRMFLAEDNARRFFDALESGDRETAFLQVHTLKGGALNLSLTRVALPASRVTEALRPGNPPVSPEAFQADCEELRAAWDETARAIREFLA